MYTMCITWFRTFMCICFGIISN